MAYPLADIRLLSWVYSLPSEMFAPVPYTRALFRNVCKGILPEDVRTQAKFNGASTLAFAHYWLDQKTKAFQKIPMQDPYGMVNLKKMEEFEAKKIHEKLTLSVREILYRMDRHTVQND